MYADLAVNLSYIRAWAIEIFYEYRGFHGLLDQLRQPDLPWLGAKRLRILLQAAVEVRFLLCSNLLSVVVSNLGFSCVLR